MKAKEYQVLQQAVESGVAYGWGRAYKHTDNPEPDQVKEAIYDAVMGEICNWFTFDDDYAGINE